MIQPEWLPALSPVLQVLTDLGVDYEISGSLASSVWGSPRTTQDADLVADIKLHHVEPFLRALKNEYYADDGMIREAIIYESSFNLLHLETMLKVDVFVRRQTAFETEKRKRAHSGWIDDPPSQLGRFTSPEDTVLQKLLWYEQGGRISERQWLDILGVLKVQNTALDQSYLREWADHLNIAELLDQAMREAGLE